MDCRLFTSRHAAFIDDTLPGIEMAAMRAHLDACRRCARRDADVRRALLLLRNVPPVRVSDGFQERLRSRIATESAVSVPAQSMHTRIGWVLAAALVTVVGGSGIASLIGDTAATPTAVRLPAVIASSAPMPPVVTSDDSAPAYLASMSSGIPMWPALMLAEEGPLRFANAELQSAGWDGTRPQH